jgi:retron-type reverse transcriptase
MKTYKNLFEKFVSFDNLLRAYKKARRGKRYRGYATDFNYHLASNLLEIRSQLLKESYRFDEYKTFYVYDPKKRLIKAPSFRDRIVHHALCNVIEPIFDKKFIFDSYACRKNKGTHRAVRRLQKFLIRMSQREREREIMLSK